MTTPILRVHPAIGLARVGNSVEYYLAPETIAALPVHGSSTTGGLPIVPGTESEPIQSTDLRDAEGRFKRQAARFRIFQYPADQAQNYPAQQGEEVTIGSVVAGRKVKDILWMAHLANKKANWYESPDDWGITAYQQPQLGQLILRNLPEGIDPHNASRRSRLVVDAGPRTILGSSSHTVHFDQDTAATAAVVQDGQAEVVPVAYPKSFPTDHFDAHSLLMPQGAIDTLGQLQTDDQGRLIVAGGHGRAVGWFTDGPPEGGIDLHSIEITAPVNNDNWFDDTSDGPVTAILIFEDGGPAMEVHGAWAVVTDPGYAPQTLNVVSLWDDVYDSFIRNLDLDPAVYANGAYNADYVPDFASQIQPIFKATRQQMWNTDLPRFALAAHEAVGNIQATDDPDDTVLANLAYVRNPNLPHQSGVGAPLMPLSLGDAGKAFLSPSYTQYFFLERWAANQFVERGWDLGPGEYLDRASLQNCLGGRFSPGIDLTFIARSPELYVQKWREAGTGPFRVNAKPLDYSQATPKTPFLSFGWVPEDPVADKGVEPGDICKFMALPWHADYNSCAIHQTAPNTLNSQTLYWSWPAQRPVSVYVAADVQAAEPGGEPTLPPQRYSVRGPGTMPEGNDLANAGRFTSYNDMLVHWQDIGVILQATQIADGREEVYESDWYLEVQSRLEDGPAALAEPAPWPMVSGPDSALNKD